jgi:hypothetical protein
VTRRFWRAVAWVLAVVVVCLIQAADFTWKWALAFAVLLGCEWFVVAHISRTPLRELADGQYKRMVMVETVIVGLLVVSFLVMVVVAAIRAATSS